MANNCIIERGPGRRIQRVLTPSGQNSELFHKIASIPLIGNRDRAVSFLKTVYSSKFIKKFGNWLKYTPKNTKAYNKIKKQIDILPENQRQAVLDKAASLDNPIMVSRVNIGDSIENLGLSYYSTETLDPNQVYLVDAINPSEIDLNGKTIPDGMTEEEYVNGMVSMNGSLVSNVTTPSGNKYTVIRDHYMKYSPSDLTEESSTPMSIYNTGEPKLYFLTEENGLYEDYGDALRNTKATSIKAGFVTGAAAEVATGGATPAAAVSISGTSVTLNDSSSFIPMMSIDISTDPSTYNGLINQLITKGLLSGSRVYNRDTNTYHFTGAGNTESMRAFNSVRAYEELANHLGYNNVSMDDNGFISIKQKDDTKMELSKNGKSTMVKKEDIINGLKAGRYEEFNAMYGNFDAVVLSLILENNTLYEDIEASLLANARKKDMELRNSIMNILSSLGIRVVGMYEYMDKYKAKNGVEPSARALADIANGVIAVGENATMEDVAEEVAHFLVETYGNQAEIEAVLESVETTEEWNAYASQYYQAYSNSYTGEELDNAVRREILGKIIAREMSSSNPAPRNTGFFASIRNIISNMVDFITRALGGQRSQLNDVVAKISDMALSDNMSGFDRSLLDSDMYVLYSLNSDKSRTDFLRRRTKDLRRTLAKFRQIRADRAVTSDMALNELRAIEKTIEKAEASIADNDMILAINSILNTLEAQVEYIKAITKEALESGDTSGKMKFKPSDRAAVDIMDKQVVPTLKEMYGYVNNYLQLPEGTSENVKESYKKRINNAIAEINTTKADIDAVLTIDKNTFFTSVLDYLNVPLHHRNKILEVLDKVQRDATWIGRWMGLLENSSNIVNRSLDALISKNYAEAMAKSQVEINKFLAEAKKGNWDIQKFRKLIQRDTNGKLTNYLRSAIRMSDFARDYKIAQLKALKTVLSDVKEIADLTDKEIEEIVDKGDGFYFNRSVTIGDKTTTTRHFIKPTMEGRLGVDIMSLEEEKQFNDIMNLWREEHEEQPYNESFRTKRERVYKRAAEILGYAPGADISIDTIEFLENQYRQKFVLKNNPEFRDQNGKFDFYKFANSINFREFQRLQKQHAEMASEYIYVAGERVMKEGKALTMARELSAISEAYREENMSPSQTKIISNETLNTIREIQRENKSAAAAWRFLMTGGHLSFVDADTDTVESEDGSKTYYKRMIEDIREYDEFTEEELELAEDAYEAIENAKQTIRDIRRFNRSGRIPGETDFDGMSAEEIEAVKIQSEIIERNMRFLSGMLNQMETSIDNYMDFGTENESAVTSEYWRHLKDSGLPEYQFIMRHTTRSKAGYISALRDKLLSANSRKKFSNSEKLFFAKELGVDPRIDDKRYKAHLREAIKGKYGEDGMTEGINIILGKYARRMVLPYFKSVSPTGFSDFLRRIENNESPMVTDKIDVAEFIEDLQSGKARKDYGFDLSRLRFEPNTEWLSEEMSERNDMNPNFKKGNDYGIFHPKKDLYEDKEYANYFGITEVNGEEKATRNLEEYNMLQTLKGIMASSLEKYGVKNKSVYQIPQISTQTLDKFTNLNYNAKSVAANMARDFVTDRVDDSIYGRTSITEGYDDSERFRAIPKYYIYELEHKDDVTHDFGYSYAMLLSQANLYEQKSNTYDYVMGMEQILLNMQFNNGKTPEATYSYRMFKDFVDNHYYGIRSNTGKITFTVAGRTVDMTKVAMGVNRAMTVMNLAFSPFVALTGAVTGQINLMIEGAVGQYIKGDSLTYAYKELSRNMPDWINDIGDIDRKSKLYLTGERLGLFNVRDRAYGAGYNRFLRTVTRDVSFKMMEIANSPLDPLVMISYMDGVRFYKGNFYTYDELKEIMKETEDPNLARIDEVWREARVNSFWNALDYNNGSIISKRGEISVEMLINEITKRRGAIKSLSQICAGSISEEAKTAASRHYIGQFVTAHRGWMSIIGQRIYKANGYNFRTMRNEEGLIQTVKYMAKRAYEMTKEDGMMAIIDNWKQEYNNMPEEARINAKRMAIYAGMFVLMQPIVAALSGWRNDDEEKDDWLTQFITYIGLRVINETASQMPLIYEMSIVDAIQDPFVSARKLSDMINRSNYSLDEVSSGNYKGESKLFRHFSRMTFLKQWYNIRTADAIRQTSEWWLQSNEKVMSLFWGGKRQSRKDDEE